MKASVPKPVIWMGDSLARLQTFPSPVQDEIGLAQIGGKHVGAKPLKGFGSGVLEVVSDHRGDTFRAVYTVRFQDRVYVLHAFQKKARKTSQSDLDLARQRFRNLIEERKRR